MEQARNARRRERLPLSDTFGWMLWTEDDFEDIKLVKEEDGDIDTMAMRQVRQAGHREWQCDRCGKQGTEDETAVKVGVQRVNLFREGEGIMPLIPYPKRGEHETAIKALNLDLCDDCAEPIIKYLSIGADLTNEAA